MNALDVSAAIFIGCGLITILIWIFLSVWARTKCCGTNPLDICRENNDDVEDGTSSVSGEEISSVTSGNICEVWENNPPSYSTLQDTFANWIIEIDDVNKSEDSQESDKEEDSSEQLPTYNDVVNEPQKYSDMTIANDEAVT